MSWWGETQMKRPDKSMGGKKGIAKSSKGPSLPSLFGQTAKKPEPDDRPKMPPATPGGRAARMNRLKNRPL